MARGEPTSLPPCAPRQSISSCRPVVRALCDVTQLHYPFPDSRVRTVRCLAKDVAAVSAARTAVA